MKIKKLQSTVIDLKDLNLPRLKLDLTGLSEAEFFINFLNRLSDYEEINWPQIRAHLIKKNVNFWQYWTQTWHLINYKNLYTKIALDLSEGELRDRFFLAEKFVFSFVSLEETKIYRNFISLIFGKKNIAIQKNEQSGDYFFCISKKSYEKILQMQNQQNLATLEMDDKLIKTIRSDEHDFWLTFIKDITQSPKNRTKTQYRNKLAEQGYILSTDGVFPSNHKPSRFTATENAAKQWLSSPQSVSFLTKDYLPKYFGFNRDRKEKLVGVILNANNAIMNRFMLYDGGTVSAPWRNTELTKVLNDKNRKCHSDSNTSSLKHFKRMILEKEHEYNEVLARIKFTMKTDKIVIFSDNFESRCLAQERARSLKNQLENLHTSNNWVWDANYEVPIVFYPTDVKQTFVKYTSKAQKADKLLANKIFSDSVLLQAALETNDLEFLYLIEDIRDILSRLEILKYLQNSLPVFCNIIDRAFSEKQHFQLDSKSRTALMIYCYKKNHIELFRKLFSEDLENEIETENLFQILNNSIENGMDYLNAFSNKLGLDFSEEILKILCTRLSVDYGFIYKNPSFIDNEIVKNILPNYPVIFMYFIFAAKENLDISYYKPFFIKALISIDRQHLFADLEISLFDKSNLIETIIYSTIHKRTQFLDATLKTYEHALDFEDVIAIFQALIKNGVEINSVKNILDLSNRFLPILQTNVNALFELCNQSPEETKYFCKFYINVVKKISAKEYEDLFYTLYIKSESYFFDALFKETSFSYFMSIHYRVIEKFLPTLSNRALGQNDYDKIKTLILNGFVNFKDLREHHVFDAFLEKIDIMQEIDQFSLTTTESNLLKCLISNISTSQEFERILNLKFVPLSKEEKVITFFSHILFKNFNSGRLVNTEIILKNFPGIEPSENLYVKQDFFLRLANKGELKNYELSISLLIAQLIEVEFKNDFRAFLTAIGPFIRELKDKSDQAFIYEACFEYYIVYKEQLRQTQTYTHWHSRFFGNSLETEIETARAFLGLLRDESKDIEISWSAARQGKLGLLVAALEEEKILKKT